MVHGAAVYAGALAGQHGVDHLHVRDVNAHAIHVRADFQALDLSPALSNNPATIIPRNTPLPVQGSKDFWTFAKDQSTIPIQVCTPSPQ